MNANSETIPSTDDSGLIGIEQRCALYRNRRDHLRALAGEVNDRIEEIKARHLPALRAALTDTADAEASLSDAVRTSDPDLWRRARSRIIHGVKIGWRKQVGKVEFDDEQKTIERIRKLLPANQAELLIRVREAVHKPSVYDLTAADLRRLGITVTDDCDVVVIRDVESELDRALESLLADIARDGNE